MLVTLVRGKGGGPVTTTALALAATWPESRPVVYMELDPSGGDVADRFLDGPGELGVITLADAMRHSAWTAGPAGEQLRAHALQLLGSIDAVLAPMDWREVRVPLDVIGRNARALAEADVDVIADCGQLEAAGPRDPVVALVRASALVLIVTAPKRTALLHAASWIDSLTDWSNGQRPSMLLVEPGDGIGEREIFEAVGVGIVGKLPQDREGARLLEGRHVGNGLGPRRRGSPSLLPLLRGARSIAEQLAPRAPTVPAERAATGGRR